MGYASGKERGCFLSGISSCPVVSPPHLSTCHQCGLRLVSRIQTFRSHWRIVLLCRECFASIRSAKTCSYCFSQFTELDNVFLDCKECSRRVHRACIPLHHRNFSHSQMNAVKFVCIDCCPIPKVRGDDPQTSGCSTSKTVFTDPLEDWILGAKSISEKKLKLGSKDKSRENATRVMVARGFAAVQLVNEPSCINLSRTDENMAVRLHHRAINGSHNISRNLCPKGVGRFTAPRKDQWSHDAVVRDVDCNSCAKVEDSTVNKSHLKDRGNFESIQSSYLLFKQENNIKPLSKYRYGDSDGVISSKFHRKGMEAIDIKRYMKKYFRKCWKSQSILIKSPLYENGDLMKQTNLCISNSLKDLSLQNSMDYGCNVASSSLPCRSSDSEGSIKIQQWSYHARGSNSISKKYFRRCNTSSPSGSSLKEKPSSPRFTNFVEGDKSMKKYFRKYCGFGRIKQRNSQSNLTETPLFKLEDDDRMKQMNEPNTVCPRKFSFNEKFNPQNSPDFTNYGSKTDSAPLPCHILSTWRNSTTPPTKNRFGNDGEGGFSKIQRRNTASMVYQPMKKYFRRRQGSRRTIQANSLSVLTNCSLFKQLKSIDVIDSGGSMKKYYRKKISSRRIMQGNSQSMSANGPMLKYGNGDLMIQDKMSNTGCTVPFSVEEKVISLEFSDSTDDCSNARSLLPFDS